MNICIFSGNNPSAVFAKASIFMNCKIQTMCVNTGISVIFTPTEAMDEDCVKILYYHHENLTICQRVVGIRMNEENKNFLSKQIEANFSEVNIQKRRWERLDNNNMSSESLQLLQAPLCFVVYAYDYFNCIHEVEIYTNLSLLEKFERFFEKVPHDSYIVFILNRRNAPFVSHFVKALLRQLGRKVPINAVRDQDIVQTWLSNNEARRDLIAHASTLKDMKAEFVVNLSPNVLSLENISVRRNVTSRYTDICLPNPSHDELKAMKCFGSDKFKQSDGSYSTHRDNMDKYLKITNFEEKRMGAFR